MIALFPGTVIFAYGLSSHVTSKVNTDLLEQQAELKKNEALEIHIMDVINDEMFINNLNSTKETISSLEK